MTLFQNLSKNPTNTTPKADLRGFDIQSDFVEMILHVALIEHMDAKIIFAFWKASPCTSFNTTPL